ncbi:FtsX-like permease family protein [Desulfacinum hydrothermale DSM 13146]|uniref:FtsX-like permease family protein n=1 Tax=Desulfacinum hydrothermale DSM 13146 TaxID=1121390 RepID=A0A1W1XSW8_9BACT|nr:FtsX-like permease family protein [Desulfacinum hydrothermale]SMC26986.1 FtsX-like permease family protein [Desulfacinum hydrothermale DSM 13146]
MKPAVERQVVLPWTQVVRISFNALRARLFRSLITTATLVLAGAFVAYTFAGYAILNGLWPHAPAELKEKILSSGYESFAGSFGSTPKDRWLIALSLLVCTVGIVNAQLMAVTERFREIGTLKCLGALDSFVIKLFVLEAAYQGLLGGALGSLLGVMVSTGTLFIKFGTGVLRHWPVGHLAWIVCWNTGLAMVLSFTGVLYPAWVAARMEPALALRTEQ